MGANKETTLPLFSSRSFSALADSYFAGLTGRPAQLSMDVYDKYLSSLKGLPLADIRPGDMDSICREMRIQGCHLPEIRKAVNLFKSILRFAPAESGVREDVLQSEYVPQGMMSGPTHVIGGRSITGRGRESVLPVLEEIAGTTRKVLETLEFISIKGQKAPHAGSVTDQDTITLEEVYRLSGWQIGK